MAKADIIIAPNGVDLEQYEALPPAQQARVALGFPQAATVFCSGHLYAGRGVDLFLGWRSGFPRPALSGSAGVLKMSLAIAPGRHRRGLSNVLFTGSSRRAACRSTRLPLMCC
jgi:hypothetical protein